MRNSLKLYQQLLLQSLMYEDLGDVASDDAVLEQLEDVWEAMSPHEQAEARILTAWIGRARSAMIFVALESLDIPHSTGLMFDPQPSRSENIDLWPMHAVLGRTVGHAWSVPELRSVCA
jgi:hypothetical protein